ncbi:MAG: UpxY family transcription antiterminator [Candidatus Acidiferrales bacterium]
MNVTHCSGALSTFPNSAHALATPAFGLLSAECESSWFAIQTWPRHEKKVAAELRDKGVSVFLPLFGEKRQWSDRRRLVESPLFPQYAFVRIPLDTAARIPVLRTNGVRGFVGKRGAGLPVPDSQIDAIRVVLAQGIPFNSHAFLNVGKRVRIRGGSLDGVVGILTAVNSDATLVVSVELIQRSLAIRIAGFTVEPV